MGRIENFRALRGHLIIGTCFRVLKDAEVEDCEKFIHEWDHLNQDEFALKANRWFMDVPESQRPSQKKMSAMWALVMQSNPYQKQRRRE